MQITIDGVPCVPACASASRIGIAITTLNRPDVLKHAIEQHMKHLLAGALVVVIDDSSKPDGRYTFNKNALLAFNKSSKT